MDELKKEHDKEKDIDELESLNPIQAESQIMVSRGLPQTEKHGKGSMKQKKSLGTSDVNLKCNNVARDDGCGNQMVLQTKVNPALLNRGFEILQL
ncbi:hypothetical protein TNCV_4829841 [Trichonephila clavipes]|nr:hypothetical protein TNCV_4829841 [Trichonephila clavipes]